ncbi:probable cytochrome P450 309a2 [Eupeodes corollae]|uniref:probable cytochrome P450 309a2 n=1 Tax=Eupeodes corollae TaxID=290404 RepID=UPI002492850D|nr:probable cytochrome P450 309a2 [Eupeodes corollae]
MAIFILILCCLSAVLGAIYIYLSWNFNFWKKRGVAGPEPKLILGTIPCIIKKNRNLAFELQDLYEKYKKTGERFIGVFMTRNPQILVIDPLLAREVMVTNFKCFRGNEQTLWVNRKLEEVSTMNPFMNSGSIWKELRSDVIGGLSPQRIKQAYPIALEICKKLTNYVKAHSQKSDGKIEVKSLCYKYTIEIISDFVWGVNADALNIDEPPNQMLKMARKLVDDSFMKIGLHYLWGLAPPIFRTLFAGRFYPIETDNFYTKVQKDAVEMRLRNKTDRSDFLNYLIQLQEKKFISHMNMVGHSATVLLDGFETAATVMAHTLYFLANNQTSQNKLREEIMANLDKNGCISYDVLVELPYLEQCINETLRLITLISVATRICSEETTLENRKGHKVKIEPGMVVHIPTYSFHNDPEVYPKPGDYTPERFDNGRAKELNQKGHFFPFGDGPRICAGMKLGQLEAKAGIVEILKNFYVKKADNYERFIDPASFLLGLCGDIFLEFESIQK